ncbi:hypothetical protein HFQ13_11070 [Acidithiobacillus sp. VAN18-1]|uniref:TrfA protein n=1 Tax=Igneacidithiobacillus copahuensis TaxID=2724909 RepID=A0AAE2YQY1_9PROT|nr:plasmid replication initiator TrfA [Igneacidithiobacillus copahuensis]MBU2788732.1 hypothetical protein [Igneacidithiobacillus copahuensis]MBU2797129.1 hypothetical protein [Acidithiobacillus sp. VAN18-2]
MENPITKTQPKALSETEEMQKRIEALADLAKQREQEEQPAQVCKVVQLPLWPDQVRAVPNVCLRSALFGAIRKGRRRYLQDEVIAAVDGLEVRYRGERLDQRDLDVYESLLHLLRDQPLGKECHTTSYALLKLMGMRDTGGERGSRAVLHRSLMRLGANMVEIETRSYSYAGSLVDEVHQDKKTREYAILLNPKLKAFFAPDQYTQIQWAIRRELEGHQLAQWLHGFYSSHAKPYPMKIETLHRLCGSEAELMSDFAKKLRKALDAVSDACTVHGEAFRYCVEDGLVSLDQTPSRSQQRHIIQQTAKRKRPGV